MSKPIEVGCRAVIVNCRENLGTEVNVVGYFGENLPFCSEDGIIWVIDKNVSYTDGSDYPIISEKYLKRIDYDGNETTSWESCEWKPEVITS